MRCTCRLLPSALHVVRVRRWYIPRSCSIGRTPNLEEPQFQGSGSDRYHQTFMIVIRRSYRCGQTPAMDSRMRFVIGIDLKTVIRGLRFCPEIDRGDSIPLTADGGLAR